MVSPLWRGSAGEDDPCIGAIRLLDCIVFEFRSSRDWKQWYKESGIEVLLL